MKNSMLIINPTAGSANALDFRDKIEKKLGTYFETVDTRITEKAKDATEFAIEACEKKYDSVFAIGGDGTVNEVIAGLAEKEYRPKFGIIPGGTVNLLGRVIGLPMSIEEAINYLDFNKTRHIDIGKSNSSYFSYILSLGKVSEGIHNVDIEEKTKFGAFAYARSFIKNVAKDKTHHIKVETENGVYEGDASHVVVLLADYFGDFKILDNNQDTDGYANVMILKDSNLISKINIIPDMIKGNVEKNDNIEFIKAKKIVISSSDDGIETDVDGDKGEYLPVEIKVLKNHLEVYY